MNLLLITTGYLPYSFSENLCNGKLVLALRQAGHHVDVISRADEGATYSNTWEKPFLPLQTGLYELSYSTGNKWVQIADVLAGCLTLSCLPIISGIRWARRAIRQGLKLHRQHPYDAILTRSPSDIPHLVGRYLHHRTGIKWLANWNDPALTIWPGNYEQHHQFSNFYNRLLHSCLTQASLNTFPSERLMRHFQRHFPNLKDQQCAVIPHIQLVESLYPRTDHQTSPVFRMCHAGNLSSERNPELLFQAIKQIRQTTSVSLQFDILGTSTPLVEQLINQYNLVDCVHFIGSMPWYQTQQVLQTYDLLVLVEAQLKEGIFFASKLTDYIQAHRPILAVSPHIGFASDLIQQCGGGLCVDNSNVQSITQGLQQMIESWKACRLNTQYSTSSIENQFKAESVTQLYEHLISSL